MNFNENIEESYAERLRADPAPRRESAGLRRTLSVISSAAESCKKKRLLVAGIFAIALLVGSPLFLILTFSIIESDPTDSQLLYIEMPLAAVMIGAMLLFIAGLITTYISAKRKGIKMSCAGVVMVRVAAIAHIVSVALFAVLCSDPFYFIPFALSLAPWVFMFLSAGRVKKALATGQGKKIFVIDYVFIVIDIILSVFIAIVGFTTLSLDLVLIMGVSGVCAVISYIALIRFISGYNNSMPTDGGSVTVIKPTSGVTSTQSDDGVSIGFDF